MMGLADLAGRLFGRRADQASAALPSSGPAQAREPAAGYDGAELAEPRFQSFVDWTPALVKQAMRSADQGDLLRAAELCDSVLCDDRIPGLWDTRTDAVMGAPVTFEAAGDGRRRGKAKRALEADEDFWVLAPESECAALLKWGRMFGAGFARLVPLEHQGRKVRSLRVWHPRWFSYDYDRRTWLVQDGVGAEKRPIRPGDGEWVIFTPAGDSRPWASGVWRALALLQVAKSYSWRDWSRYNEAHGSPTWKIEGEKNEARRRRLAAAFGDLGRNPAVALPEGVTASLVEATADSWETFQAQIHAIDTAASIAILGGNLLSEVSGNQQTGATGQKDNQRAKARGDAAALATCIHDQALTWWAYDNFGDYRLAPWPTWHTEPTDPVAWKQVGEALVKLRAAGFRVNASDIVERFGIPVIDAEPVAIDDSDKAVADAGNGDEKGDDDAEDKSDEDASTSDGAEGDKA